MLLDPDSHQRLHLPNLISGICKGLRLFLIRNQLLVSSLLLILVGSKERVHTAHLIAMLSLASLQYHAWHSITD